MTRTVVVAEHFTLFPFGRYQKHGPFSGEALREDFLMGPLERGENVILDMTGVNAPASFMEEVFGGLVRRGLSAQFIGRHLRVYSDDAPGLAAEAMTYVDLASEDVRS